MIQFKRDAPAFPNGEAVITLTNNSQLTLAKAGTVVDGTTVIHSGPLLDARAQPSAVDPFAMRRYPTRIHIDPVNKAGHGPNSGSFLVTAQGVQLIGLQVERVLGSDAEVANQDQDLIVFGANSRGGVIRNALLDGGAGTRPSAADDMFSGKDGMEVTSGSGALSFAPGDAILIEQTEIRHDYDRGLKGKDGYVLFRDSWIHHNLRGGGFALNPRGRLRIEHTAFEENGKNASGVVTREPAEQVSAQEAGTAASGTRLEVDGSLSRNGTSCGIFSKRHSTAMIEDSWVCGMPGDGLQITADAGVVQVRGTASVLNGRGVLLPQSGGVTAPADFGIGLQAGDNAFTKNFLKQGETFLNFRIENGVLPAAVVQVQGNQWEHCGNGATCVLGSSALDTGIRGLDIEGRTNENVSPPNDAFIVATAQAHRNPGAIAIDDANPDPSLDGVYPRKVANMNDLVYIHGRGFNAIEGYEFPGASCTNLSLGNTCSPLNGTCVEFENAQGEFRSGRIVAITPTFIAVRAPFACSRPGDIRIKRLNAVGPPESEVVAPDRFCRN